jgi:hypothetical protein
MVKGKPVLPVFNNTVNTLVGLGYQPKAIVNHIKKCYMGEGAALQTAAYIPPKGRSASTVQPQLEPYCMRRSGPS